MGRKKQECKTMNNDKSAKENDSEMLMSGKNKSRRMQNHPDMSDNILNRAAEKA